MDITIKTVVKMTLKPRGRKAHDIASFVEDFFNLDDSVAFVNCGEIPYKDIISMGDAILHYAQRTHRRMSFHTIKGNNEELIVFKI